MLKQVHGDLGRGARAIVLGVAFLSLFAGCANQEDAKKRIKEADGHYQQGLSVMETDQQRAFVAFQKAVQLNPSSYDAHYALGHIYFMRQEYAEAERVFRKAIELDRLSGDALNYLGRTLIYQKRYPEAVEVLTKATALPLYAAPDQAYTNLGNALELQGDNAGAIRALNSALKIDPPNIPRPLTYLMLARVYMKQGEDAKAREALAMVKSLDPNGEAGAAASKMMERLR